MIGETDARAGDVLVAAVRRHRAPLVRTSVETAEMVKYADNILHALKVAFANEIGNLCKAVGDRQPRGDGDLLPGHQAQPVALLPEARLRVRRLVPAQGRARAHLQGAQVAGRAMLPMLNAMLPSNQLQMRARPSRWCSDKGSRRVGVLGFSFKAGTDDLRESPSWS